MIHHTPYATRATAKLPDVVSSLLDTYVVVGQQGNFNAQAIACDRLEDIMAEMARRAVRAWVDKAKGQPFAADIAPMQQMAAGLQAMTA